MTTEPLDAIYRVMGITEKTRKILWGRSGSRCAFCKHDLIVNATEKDSEAVVGDECHIISSRENGPRHDSSYPQDQLDSYENLILLCRIHHKTVDDQDATFTTEILRQVKSNHEVWVSEKLTARPIAPLKFRRIKKNIPSFLFRLTTGKQVLDLISNCYAFYMNNDELTSPEEVSLVGDFFQTLEDIQMIKDELEPREWIHNEFDITQSLQILEQAGFYVFGAREVQLLEGGNQLEPSDWPVAIINIFRSDRPEIIQVNLNDVINAGGSTNGPKG